MAKYRVELVVSGYVTLEVEADSAREAGDLAEELYGDGHGGEPDVHDWDVYQITECE